MRKLLVAEVAALLVLLVVAVGVRFAGGKAGIFMEENCIFCKIIRGDFNTEFVLENDYAVVFNDINPAAPIHMLVVPKLHVESLNELDNEELLGKLMMTVREVTKKIGLNSYKTLINTGKDAGQEVFHLHIHIMGDKK